MFYLSKRTRVVDCKVGDKVMVLSDFPGGGIEAGWKGTVDENYERGISIRWAATGRCDGFGEDELECLAFGTEAYSDSSMHQMVLSDDEATALSVLEDATTEDLGAIWEAMQDRIGALLPYSSNHAASYLKAAMGRLCKAIAEVQMKQTDEGTGYPRDVALTVSPVPALLMAVVPESAEASHASHAAHVNVVPGDLSA